MVDAFEPVPSTLVAATVTAYTDPIVAALRIMCELSEGESSGI